MFDYYFLTASDIYSHRVHIACLTPHNLQLDTSCVSLVWDIVEGCSTMYVKHIVMFKVVNFC